MDQAFEGFNLVAWSMVVSDLERATRFYCEGLGFTVGQTGERGPEMAAAMELPSCRFRIRYLSRPDARLELVQFDEPETLGDGARKASNRLGVQTMAYTCPDPHATAQKLVALGGTQLFATKSGGGRFDSVMTTDPDGMRVLLVSAALDDIRPIFGEPVRAPA